MLLARVKVVPTSRALDDPAAVALVIEDKSAFETMAVTNSWRRRNSKVLYGDTITSLTSWNAEPDRAEGESFRVEFPIVVD
jgi:hypothetical protein